MPALFFPNLDTLRLALASGLLPTALTSAPVRSRVDAPHVWVELDELLPRETITALGRLGVIALGTPGAPTQTNRSWAELLPLRKVSPGPGPVLFDVPDRQLAAFVARLRSLHAETTGVRLLPEPHIGRAWVVVPAPPLTVLLWAEEPESPVRAYRQQAPGVWTARGWEHPLAGHLTVPIGCVLLCDPERGATAFAAPVPLPTEDEFALRHKARAAAPPKFTPRAEVRFRLARCDEHTIESLWVLAKPEQESFREFCRNADERLLRRFQVATAHLGSETRVLVRRTANDDTGVGLPVPTGGYRVDLRIPSLFAPVGFALRPRVRATELARELQLCTENLTWLEPLPHNEFAVHSVPFATFRPVSEHVEYAAPTGTALSALRIPADPFPFAKFALRVDPATESEPEVEELTDEHTALPTEAEPSWVSKSVGIMVRWLRGRAVHPPDETKLSTPGSRIAPVRPENPKPPSSDPNGERERKLSSADALLHGHDRAARRHDLESRLLKDFPKLGPDERAARWAELAGVYGAIGQSLDAAVCWVNAVWECALPPTEWLEQWAEAECHAVKRGDRTVGLDRWLAEPGRPGTGRVVAALAASAGFQPTPPAEFVAALPRVLAVLDQHFDDIPVRGAWLARIAVARSCDGDVLGLARWRDRLVARLHDRGPGLDLDEPSFLRFRGPANADRFKTAREWLTRVKEPVLAWVQRHTGGGRFAWTGLEAETDATAVYAQFLLAWGLGALGERARARDWSARARKALARASGPRADPAAHALLGDLFLHRIKDAHEGGAPKSGLPPELQERLEKLPELPRYSVDRLREHCRILEPLGGVRGSALALKTLWGTDRLGERLSVFGSRTGAAQLNDEARALLAVATEEPTTATVPRIAFALLEFAAHLDPPVLDSLLSLVPTALDWMEAWVRAGRWREDERDATVTRYQKSMLDSTFAVAPTAVASTLLRHLARGATSGHLLAAATAAAPRAFRAARKFGLVADADALMRVLDPARAEWGKEPLTADRVGLAIGWFTAGDEEAGNRILNTAREQLFLAAPNDRQERTAIALAYAEALGFAPAGIALGRLEELFQRLDRVTVGGSTNCYFTLQPLRLIDTVVRSVVTDEFTLGATVRAWLDEDEFLIRRRIHRDMTALLRESELV